MKLLESTTLDPTEITLGEDHDKHLDDAKIGRLLSSLQAGAVLPPVVLDADHKLVAGRNRYEAYGRAGLPVRADVVSFADHLESQELSIRENLDRKRLTAVQEAEALAQLVWIEEQRDAGQAHAAVAERQRKPRSKSDRIREIASETGRSERKVQRAVKQAEEARNPPAAADPIVPPPAKPVAIERLILEYAARVKALAEEGQALLPKALAEPGRATGATWRGSLRIAVAEIVRQVDVLVDVADEIKRGRGALAQVDIRSGEAARLAKSEEAKARRQKKWEAEEPERIEAAKNAALGPEEHICNGPPCTAFPGCTKAARIAKGGGLKAPPRIKVKDQDGNLLAEGEPSGAPPLPSPEAIRRTWDEGAAVFGPGDDDAF